MSKFALIRSKLVSGTTKIPVYELYVNNQSLIQEFVSSILSDDNLSKELAAAFRAIEDSSNLKRLPKTKFRPIKDAKLPRKLYEAKSGSIRIYLIHEEGTGRVILVGGKKDNQKEDIRSVKKLIKAFSNE